MPMIVGAIVGASASTNNKDTSDLHGNELSRLKEVSTGLWSGEEESAVASAVEMKQNPVELASNPEEEQQEEEPTYSFARLEWIDNQPIERPDSEATAGAEDQDDKMVAGTVRDWRGWLYTTFDEPQFSRLAYGLSIGVLVCIAVSIVAIVIETLPSLRDDDDAGKVFIGIEWTSSIVFTIEYLCKFVPVTQKCWFVRQPMNIIDLVAILPFYVELICDAAGVSVDISILRLLRVVRIFRVFKLSKYSTNIQLCATVMIDSKDSLGLMVFMLSIVGVVFASFEFYCEKGTWNDDLGYYVDDDGKRSRYDSIPATMWWCVVTVMTVGYGDLYPITVPGKIVAAGSMVCAIVIMALPISVVGSNFSRAWSEAKAKEDMKSESQRLSAAFEMLVESLGEHGSILEDLLSEVSRICESLSLHLGEAHREYTTQLRRVSGDAQKLCDPDGKLKALVETIVGEQKQLEEVLAQVTAAQDGRFEAEVTHSLELSVEMSNLMLQHQELSANVVGMEAVMFGRSLS